MQPNSEYEYDVAFSFLKEDEELATKINDLLQDRFKTFLYSKNQENVSGLDGESIFSSIFASRARVVVVLYRAGWGQTPWTRIEETAIRNRAYSEGYDFSLFVVLDSPPGVPPWLPKTRLWLGFARYGLQGAAGAIEARVQDQGGESTQESLEDAAARVERALRAEKGRREFLDSEAGVRAASEELAALFAALERGCRDVADKVSLSILRDPGGRCAAVEGHGLSMLFSWQLKWANTLQGSGLRIAFYPGQAPMPRRVFAEGEEPRRLASTDFQFDLGPSEERGWRGAGSDGHFYTSDRLATIQLKDLLERIRLAGLRGGVPGAT